MPLPDKLKEFVDSRAGPAGGAGPGPHAEASYQAGWRAGKVDKAQARYQPHMDAEAWEIGYEDARADPGPN